MDAQKIWPWDANQCFEIQIIAWLTIGRRDSKRDKRITGRKFWFEFVAEFNDKCRIGATWFEFFFMFT